MKQLSSCSVYATLLEVLLIVSLKIAAMIQPTTKNQSKGRKSKNFPRRSEATKFQETTRNWSVSMTRDLFGSILFHALQAEVDMEQVLKYPLTTVPLSTSHVDGTMQKNTQVEASSRT